MRCTVPTSLLAHMTVATATSSAVPERLGQRLRARPGPLGVDRQPGDLGALVLAQPVDASSTAWCSTGLTTSRRRRASAPRRAQKMPLTARLSLSVPPPVKMTSDGRAPSAAAIRSRDSSTTRRARAAAACSDDALPTRPSCAVIAASASGSIGVVAAWSRYVMSPPV